MRIFAAVYKENSITEAAKKLGIAQPAASLAIHEIESYYKVKLFERKGRGIERTESAKHLYQYAAHIVSLYYELDNEFKNLNASEFMKIGSRISIGACLMPQYINGFVRKYETPMPYVKIDSSEIIEKLVSDNKLDFGLIEGNIHSENLLSEHIANDNLTLVCGLSHPLAIHNTVKLDDLREQSFLLREKNSGTREFAEATLMLNNFTVTPLWESTSTTAIINGVSANIGLSILPYRLVEPYIKENKIKALEIEGIKFERHYSIIYHQNKYITKSMNNFFDYVKNVRINS